METITCLWQTIADWATLTAQDEALFEAAVTKGGPFVRVCADGTVWMNETLALTLTGVLP